MRRKTFLRLNILFYMTNWGWDQREDRAGNVRHLAFEFWYLINRKNRMSGLFFANSILQKSHGILYRIIFAKMPWPMELWMPKNEVGTCRGVLITCFFVISWNIFSLLGVTHSRGNLVMFSELFSPYMFRQKIREIKFWEHKIFSSHKELGWWTNW